MTKHKIYHQAEFLLLMVLSSQGLRLKGPKTCSGLSSFYLIRWLTELQVTFDHF